jgi:hypothetical protein
MIIILIAVIVLLLLVIVWLNVEFYKEKRDFRVRLAALQQVIAERRIEQTGQLGQIRLSEEMDQTLKANNSVLSHDIFSLNYELFDLLSKNNLLRK